MARFALDASADTSPRDPQRGPLHALLREHLETFLTEREEAGAPLPRFVVEERRYRRLARKAGLREPRGGAVTVMQRFSSDLRTNLHLHSLAPDGAYGVGANGQRRFFTTPAPSPAEACRAR